MDKKKKTLLALAIAGAVGVGALVPALAQEATEDPTDASTESTHRDDFAAALAEELGLPEERVVEALEAVRDEMFAEVRAAHRSEYEERLAAAVADGALTQEQADAILAAYDNGVELAPGPAFGPGHGSHVEGPGHRGREHGGPGSWTDLHPDADDTEASSAPAA